METTDSRNETEPSKTAAKDAAKKPPAKRTGLNRTFKVSSTDNGKSDPLAALTARFDALVAYLRSHGIHSEPERAYDPITGLTPPTPNAVDLTLKEGGGTGVLNGSLGQPRPRRSANSVNINGDVEHPAMGTLTDSHKTAVALQQQAADDHDHTASNHKPRKAVAKKTAAKTAKKKK